MEISKSQQQILNCLKTRGPQSVKILARQMQMTPMGARQHLTGLQTDGYIKQTSEEKQTRGRPVHLWKLTEKGHLQFPDTHAQVTLEFIEVIQDKLGLETLYQVIDQRNDTVLKRYHREVQACGEKLEQRIAGLSQLRTEEGYMSQIRMLPDGAWLLIENHCPIFQAAKQCQQFCRSELKLFQNTLGENVTVERIDHVLAGARRCAYKVSPIDQVQPTPLSNRA